MPVSETSVPFDPSAPVYLHIGNMTRPLEIVVGSHREPVVRIYSSSDDGYLPALRESFHPAIYEPTYGFSGYKSGPRLAIGDPGFDWPHDNRPWVRSARSPQFVRPGGSGTTMVQVPARGAHPVIVEGCNVGGLSVFGDTEAMRILIGHLRTSGESRVELNSVQSPARSVLEIGDGSDLLLQNSSGHFTVALQSADSRFQLENHNFGEPSVFAGMDIFLPPAQSEEEAQRSVVLQAGSSAKVALHSGRSSRTQLHDAVVSYQAQANGFLAPDTATFVPSLGE